jgi:malonate transporter MadL subunit
MVIYGVALLAFSMLVGIFIGDLLGILLGVQANVGGVGIAMMLLIILSNLSHHKFHLNPVTETGITFWSAMYIPIVVAMAAKQNIIAAVSSGWLAVIAGLLAVAFSFALIPVFARISNRKSVSGEKNVTGGES